TYPLTYPLTTTEHRQTPPDTTARCTLNPRGEQTLPDATTHLPRNFKTACGARAPRPGWVRLPYASAMSRPRRLPPGRAGQRAQMRRFLLAHFTGGTSLGASARPASARAGWARGWRACWSWTRKRGCAG